MISNLQQDSYITEDNLKYGCDICGRNCSKEIFKDKIFFRCFNCGKSYTYRKLQK